MAKLGTLKVSLLMSIKCSLVLISSMIRLMDASFSGLGGGQGERSPSETETIVIEIWCYLPEHGRLEERGGHVKSEKIVVEI